MFSYSQLNESPKILFQNASFFIHKTNSKFQSFVILFYITFRLSCVPNAFQPCTAFYENREITSHQLQPFVMSQVLILQISYFIPNTIYWSNHRVYSRHNDPMKLLHSQIMQPSRIRRIEKEFLQNSLFFLRGTRSLRF
jgi:hypothetical protein